MKVLIHPVSLYFILLFFTSCASVPKGHFVDDPSKTDYSLARNWAALPTKKDSADAVPINAWKNVQDESPVDIFFIHPTTYVGHAGQHQWNADLDDEKLNLYTDQTTIKYQASCFNGAGRVYAPRYRQAHLDCFYSKRTEDGRKALDLAYQDVRSAFEYYLNHYNQGRPFVIAAHSQGTVHGARLIKELIDGQPVQALFVAAYLPGMPVPADYFNAIHPCNSPDETGCFCSWRTFRKGYIPAKYHMEEKNIVVTNPVTWNSNVTESTKEEQLGAVLRDFHKVIPSLVSTSIYEDLLWVNKPKFKWSFLLMTKNYHIADYNFFYADVRRNAQDRVQAYLAN